MSTEKSLPQRDFKSLRILMAEDDKLNQALAKILFKKMDCNYDIVETGIQVLEKIKQDQYDLILMDVEMPEMNGYMTTIKIRSDLKPLSEIPIIATTAHVNNTELEKCLAVGMNDYLFKPIKLNELITKIKYFVKGFNENVTLSESAIQSTENKTEFNLKSLYVACGDNASTVKNIVKIFVAQHAININQLNEFIAAKEWQNLKNLCHKMKAVYSLIGLPKVKTYLEEIEEDCGKKNINSDKFKLHVELIRELNAEILPELEKVLNEN